MCSLAPTPAFAESEPAAEEARLLGAPGVPKDILHLLDETKETYGPDAVLLQLQLLHHAIHAESILAAGVRVTGIEVHDTRQFLFFAVETGIVFNSERVERHRRVSRLWSRVVIPALSRLGTYDMPGDGIAAELRSFHRSYRDADELEDTVSDDPGVGERVVFHILYSDILAFRRREIDASQLYSRSHTRVDEVPFAEPLLPDP